MTKLIPWKDQEINKLRKEIDHLFSRVWSGFGASVFPGERAGAPFIDVAETEKTLTLKAELPGINPDDLDISVEDDVLTISGEKYDENVEEKGYYHRVERTFGSFSRGIRLPCRVEVDRIQATYKKGILYIVMPKCKPESARKIKVKIT